MIRADEGVDRAMLRTLQELIDNDQIRSAVYRRCTESTNTDALAEFNEIDSDANLLPRLYLTDSQTAGRGRQGNRWISPSDSLTFSIVLDTEAIEFDLRGLLSLAAGIATARTIEFVCAPAKAMLKWPNDVYLAGGKVAGVLIETTQRHPHRAVVGIGVNINELPAMEEHRLDNAESIGSATGRICSGSELLGPLVSEVVEMRQKIVDSPHSVVNEFRNRCYLTGKEITYRDSGAARRGICEGIDREGRLLVRSHDAMRVCESGAVDLVRPVSSPS